MKKHQGWLLAGIVNLGAAVLAALAFGIWKRANPEQVDQASVQTRMEGSIVAGFFDQNIDDVGFIAGANKHITARKMAGSQILYDVTYTTGPDHFRVVVPQAEKPERCILLFGDSFTFGEGVNDAETSAAQIVVKSKGRVAAKNLGIAGWGPHQFLAGLQSGRFQSAISCRPTDAIYLLIHAHLGRAAGRSPWDTHGPLFRLVDGRPVRVGNFDTDRSISWRKLIGLNALTEVEEADLATALIAEGARELGRLYPGIRFRVFAWIDITDEMAALLSGQGLDVRRVQDVIPDFTGPKYQIPLDGHPNARADERIADYILSLP